MHTRIQNLIRNEIAMLDRNRDSASHSSFFRPLKLLTGGEGTQRDMGQGSSPLYLWLKSHAGNTKPTIYVLAFKEVPTNSGPIGFLTFVHGLHLKSSLNFFFFCLGK